MKRFLFIYVTAAILFSLCISQVSAENLLANPSFERLGEKGVPISWIREFNKNLGGPFNVVTDAYDGKRAACLMTEEWNYQRPQFITQTVKLSNNTKTVYLSAYCKGQGQVNLAFRFLKDDKPYNTVTIKKGFDMVNQPTEILNEFALGQTYELYEAFAKVPDGADGVMVKLGNTIGLLNRLNIWGKVWIDNATLTASAEVIPETKPTHKLTENFWQPVGCKDIAPLTRVVMQPPSFEPRKIFDGNVETTVSFMRGIGRGANINFLFAEPVPVYSVSIYLNGNVEDLVIRGDAEGDGIYETIIGRAAGLSGKGWLTIRTDKRPVHAVRIQPIRGRISGFRKAMPFTNEIKIFIAEQYYLKASPKYWRAFRKSPQPKPDVPQLSLKPIAMILPEMKNSRFRRMISADLWMWGIHGAYKKDAKAEGCTNNPTFRTTLEMVKRMGIEAILIDLTVSSSRNLMPWPSKVCNSTKENFLKPLIDALHTEGLEVFVELLHNITPFETIKWHYPQEETSRYPGMKQYPSIIHGEHFKKNWLTITKEIMACGADGLGISFDEHYYKGHFMETFPKEDPGRALYKKRFGYELPEHEEDTLKFRQWIVMRHEGIADLFGYWVKNLKNDYPDIYTNTMFQYPTNGYSYITENGIPLDLIGARSGITEVGSDYQGPYGIRLSSAVNGWRKGTMLHNGDMWPYPPLPDLHFYKTALWNLMYGAGSINYWRYNYVVNYGHASALTRTYSIVKDLDALGLWDARPPKKIALLSSRASIDWWQIKAWWGKRDDLNWDRGLEGQRSWFADQSVFNILQKNGYPFDWFFLDHPSQLKNLEEYAVLLVPFAYSIDQEAASHIETAARKGTKVLFFDGKLGPTDKWGEPYPEPVFKSLIDSENVILFEEDVLAWGATDIFADRVIAAIDKALDQGNPFKLHRYGLKIDATMIEKSPTERFVFLTNHEQKQAIVDMEMSLPNGNYEIFARDENRWYRASIESAEIFSSQNLRKFQMMIARGKPYVLYIRETK